MAILGNILGLGIYDRMESMAANRAADANRELRRIADLQEETGRTMPDKATVEAAMNKTAVEKASAVADRAIHTKAMSEAQTKLDIAKQAQKRSEKLADELGSWIAEKNANASAQTVCRAQISDAQALLDKREEVEAGSQSYGKLSARREELLGTAALIQPRKKKLRDVMAALSAQRKRKAVSRPKNFLHRQRVGAMSRPSRTMTSSSGKRQTSQERANGSPRWKNRTSSISQQTKRP